MTNSGVPDTNAGNAFPRRDFLTLAGLTLVASAANSLPVMAGPFDNSDFSQLVPPNKKLTSSWLHSLTERGAPEIYTKDRDELIHIGMPVGGICCGTVYLGGDGKLWVWDIFNQNQAGVFTRPGNWTNFTGNKAQVGPRDGGGYVDPYPATSPLEQGFAVQVDGHTRTLNAIDWHSVQFKGQYPVGTVDYGDPSCAVSVTLTAYSPFIPLNADDSGLPATICEIKVVNHGAQVADVKIGGWLENACSLYTAKPGVGSRTNTATQSASHSTVLSSFKIGVPDEAAGRPDIVVDDFERSSYAPWRVEGTAFGLGPVRIQDVPSYQGDLNAHGTRTVNSHASSPGKDIASRDAATGKLISPPFKLERQYLTFLIGGGSNSDQVGMRLIVDGATVAHASGHDNNAMRRDSFDTSQYVGRTAIIEIYDNGTGPWGNIGVDDIVQSDSPVFAQVTSSDPDFGTMALTLMGSGTVLTSTSASSIFSDASLKSATGSVGKPLISGAVKTMQLAPGVSETATFVLTWHFPNAHLPVTDAVSGASYAKKHANAASVAYYIVENYTRLAHDTKLWRDTWNDTTLPHWFMNRTFANTSILATTTAHRFQTGRFWGWEGVGCCEGTCTHVWHYAQAVGRIFPEIERHTREFVDFGTALYPDGTIGYRGEGTGPAVDGQCGRILGVYREHQMSPDSAFLKRLWPRVKTAMGFLMRHDRDHDGLLDGAQENTLDAAWYGEIAWISSLYAAALRACELMAIEVNDANFAALCASDFKQTKAALETQLFNGEYFIQKPEPGRESALGTYGTCHIDQVHGQSWAWQVGMGRILDQAKTLSALKSLYKYNFAPDVGVFRRHNTAGRPYAIQGDAGLIMATNPHNLPHPFGNSSDWQFGYFNECMSGFEHQAASHMVAEDLIVEGLTVTKAIHDRYHARLRNPYNEVECSDHYSRAMASYGTFITACGFEYNGPHGVMRFDPKIHPEDFRAPFTSAEGWGTYAQKTTPHSMTATLAVRHGRLRLMSLRVSGTYQSATISMGGNFHAASVMKRHDGTEVTLNTASVLVPGTELTIHLT